MAYFQNRNQNQNRRKQSDNWEEEGSRYRGIYARDRYQGRGPRRDQDQDGHGARPKNGYGEHFQRNDRTDSRDARPGRPAEGGRGRDNRGRDGGRRSFSQPRTQSYRRPAPAGDRPGYDRTPREEPSYRDFEHVTPQVERETSLPPENLLAGRNPIREALKSGRDLEKLLIARGELSGSAREIVQMAREAKVPVQEVDKTRLDELAAHHQGMVAYASAYHYSTVEDILNVAKERNEEPFLILLDSVTDPHNLGAVIRTAECAGAHGVIVPERRSVGLTPAAVKASAGAVEFLKVARVPNLNRTIAELKERGIWVYALSMDGEDYEKVDFTGATALVIGSEGEGISRLVMDNCDQKVSLPLKGHIESLNASVAAGIVMYRVLRSRSR